MKVEMVFRIYRRLMRGPKDYCNKLVITADDSADLLVDPTAVRVTFVPRRPRELCNDEKTLLKFFAEYHRVDYYISDSGDMIWGDRKSIAQIKKKIQEAKEKCGQT
jgi:hypothetical protein